jgi:hypothetical protein
MSINFDYAISYPNPTGNYPDPNLPADLSALLAGEFPGQLSYLNNSNDVVCTHDATHPEYDFTCTTTLVTTWNVPNTPWHPSIKVPSNPPPPHVTVTPEPSYLVVILLSVVALLLLRRAKRFIL